MSSHGPHLGYGHPAIAHIFPIRGTITDSPRQEARRVYSNFIQDCFIFKYHGMLYRTFMTKVIDHF